MNSSADDQAAASHVRSYGVNETFSKDHPLSLHIEEIYFHGYTVVEGVLDKATLESMSGQIDRIYDQQMEELGGVAIAEAIHDANCVRCPLVYEDAFVDLAKSEVMIEIIKGVLGPNFTLLMQNAIINQPVYGNEQTRWHRDLNYQHWTSSKPIALNALFTIDPFTVETGCTHILPGTHLRPEFPSDRFIEKHETPLSAPAGSVIIMDAMAYHRAGDNTSDKPRRAVNHVIGLPFLSQQIDIPAVVGDRLAVDDFSRAYFGYRWHPASSPKDWRIAKLPRSD